MTHVTAADLLAAIRAAPADDLPRLVYADWLEERGGDAECPDCDRGWRPKIGTPDPGMVTRCLRCRGTGRVPNANAARAEFIRVQCELANPGAVDRAASHWPEQIGVLDSCRCRPCRLRRRERELLEAHHRAWFSVAGGTCIRPVNTGQLYWQPEGGAAAFPVEVRRGFMHWISAPLAVLIGTVCENCGGFGEFRRRHDNGDGPEGPCPDCGGRWTSGPHDDLDALWDKGTGRTRGVLAGLCAAEPVERVEVTDRAPLHFERAWLWHNADHPLRGPAATDERDTLPADLHGLLRGHLPRGRRVTELVKAYRTEELARAELVDALLAHVKTPA